MKIESTTLPGCFLLQPDVREDARGRFVKPFNRAWFQQNGLDHAFEEVFYSVSHRGVLRGLHFQTPPHEHAKLVYCMAGRAFDVLLDIRVGSPTEGRHACFELSAVQGNMLYMPPGIAHGFCALSDDVRMVYQTTSAHEPASDQGILWNTAGIRWPDMPHTVSDRDQAFAAYADFSSPFRYRAG